jgi:Lar family restriction alleviation protein
MVDDLKPCPFCGKDDQIVMQNVDPETSDGVYIGCGRCGFSFNVRSADQARDDWNQRVLESSLEYRLGEAQYELTAAQEEIYCLKEEIHYLKYEKDDPQNA